MLINTYSPSLLMLDNSYLETEGYESITCKVSNTNNIAQF